MKTKIFTLLFAIVASIGIMRAEIYTGTCGENLTYTFDTESGVLTISGSGEMNNYDGYGSSPWYSFQYIASVVISNGVTSIGDYAFYYCSSLTSITIPSSVTSIGSSAFSGCSSLTSVTIPNSVTGIGEYAFSGCSSLTSVTIPNSVTSIGNSAFEGCSSLTSVTIPNSVTSIGNKAFYCCSGLTSVTIPNSVTSIGSIAFLYCSSLTSPVYNAHVFAFMPTSYSGAYTIPDGIESMAGGAFWHCSGLTSVTIPNSVTSIGYSAFYGCSSLTSVTIPNSVTSIGSSAFYQCVGLTSVTIGNGVTSIGGSAFAGCSNITSLIIPNSAQFVTSGDVKTFAPYINLTYVEAPAPFFDIPEAQWPSYTKSLNHVTVNGGELTENALLFINRSYKTLQTLDVSGVTNTEFADEAFKGFYNLKELVLPALLQKVSYMMVAGCKNLQSVVIPASVEEIEQSAFEDCRSLQSITFGDQQNAAPGRFNVPASTENRLKHIGNWAFYNAHELKSIEIPEGVEEIGEGAFYGCTYLEDLVLPTSVRYVGDNTFALCAKLKKITVNSVTPPSIQAKKFFDVKRQIPVYVPDGSENDYKAADGWKEFFNIQPVSAMATAIDEMQASEELTGTPRKVLIDGQLFIRLPNGTRYNLQGMEIK